MAIAFSLMSLMLLVEANHRSNSTFCYFSYGSNLLSTRIHINVCLVHLNSLETLVLFF